MRTAVVLFTRDLRLRDNPALHAACAAAERVVPLFVLDPRIRSSPNRRRFLAECLADLRESLRARGGDLVVRHGDPVEQAVKVAREVGAFGIGLAADHSAYAAARQRRLAEACDGERLALRLFDGVTVVPPGALKPTGGGDHYRVFTPYWRAWQGVRRREVVGTPRRVTLPDGLTVGRLPAAAVTGGSPDVVPGGESAARERLSAFRRRAGGYAEGHDDLAGDRTSRLSPYLHFGCLSPVSLESTVDSPEFVRQLCWRDFYHQVLAGFPELPRRAYRRGTTERWRYDEAALDAWKEGRTGVSIVDAGMRQLLAEGFMHNRARLVTASYLTKHLELDWREGAAWFARWLLDADVANNWGNWQWVAGTGNDTRPHRRFNPERQARRFDPDGGYRERYLR
ncbi:cryptochrome/photolyase family protein [Phytohabitans suffuscus]|uniref:Deoxyribodipyrimidine photo-lyase n=1 Tax=Phytohabitans suffuscus TaxID=624315 RepID=A0A6F8YYK2_9ACTN|nr:deoxyribodipyrimidine photo-lyase [Phytohabitans suffuscus]BCB91159.1 deoxyribodipyrimidine photo-lyase [Phytohabitans suffuscus]